MRNRAKCKLCKSIIESFTLYDYVMCKCGEIAISGGTQEANCSAKNWNNFLRIDDLNNEVIPKIIDPNMPSDTTLAEDISQTKLTKKDMLKMLEEMINGYERLPQQALNGPVSNLDMISALMLIKSIFTVEE